METTDPAPANPGANPSLEPHGESSIKLPSGTDSQLETTPAHPEDKPGNAHPESPVNEPIVPTKESPTGKDLSDKVTQAAKDKPVKAGKRAKVSGLPDFHYEGQEGELREENEHAGRLRFDDGHEFWIQKRNYKK